MLKEYLKTDSAHCDLDFESCSWHHIKYYFALLTWKILYETLEFKIFQALKCHLALQFCSGKLHESVLFCTKLSQDLVNRSQFISHIVKGLEGRVSTNPRSFPLLSINPGK